MQIYQSDQKKS